MTRTDTHPTPGAEHSDDVKSHADDPSVVETVATTATGMVLGGAALWFLAPICFVC